MKTKTVCGFCTLEKCKNRKLCKAKGTVMNELIAYAEQPWHVFYLIENNQIDLDYEAYKLINQPRRKAK